LSISVDHTRAVLKDGDPDVPGSDYINANYISVVCLLNQKLYAPEKNFYMLFLTDVKLALLYYPKLI